MIRINFLRQYGPNMARLEAWYRLCDDISKTTGGYDLTPPATVPFFYRQNFWLHDWSL